jgi:WXXGXW repeat (2 copies)
MRYQKILLALIPALLLCAAPTASQAAFGIGVSVNIAPPALPVYEQPPLPAPGYIWTPGYWAWDGSDYYWVPGTWVEPPQSEMLWTPGYWGWNDGLYLWNAGYWGPQVGFYGGVNYGFGYGGSGYQGGYWHGGAFFYNRSVANFGHVNIVNVYNAPVPHGGVSRISFNGGQGGLRAQPTSGERMAMNGHHIAATSMQIQHEQHAASMPAMHMHQNGGHPQILTTQRAGDFAHPGPGLSNHHAAGAGAAMQMHGGPAHPQGGAPREHEGQGAQFGGGAPEHRAPEHGAPEHHEGAPAPQAMHAEPHAQQHEQGPRPGAGAAHEQGHGEPERHNDH